MLMRAVIQAAWGRSPIEFLMAIGTLAAYALTGLANNGAAPLSHFGQNAGLHPFRSANHYWLGEHQECSRLLVRDRLGAAGSHSARIQRLRRAAGNVWPLLGSAG
jgi:hypothetical protein